MKPSEVIDTMLTDIIPDESRWIQHAMTRHVSGEEDKHCMLGALTRATTLQVGQDWFRTRAMITDQIRALPGHHIDSVIAFNDAHGRTYDEVREVLEKARAAAQEMGQ